MPRRFIPRPSALSKRGSPAKCKFSNSSECLATRCWGQDPERREADGVRVRRRDEAKRLLQRCLRHCRAWRNGDVRGKHADADPADGDTAPARGAADIRKAYLHSLGIHDTSFCGKPLVTPRTPRADYDSDDSDADRNVSEFPKTPHMGHRERLLQKLAYESVLLPMAHRPKLQQSLIVFDWDDTLLCTSRLSSWPDPKKMPVDLRRWLSAIEEVAKDLLLKSMSLGRTIIITNAVKGWVEATAAEYMPGLLPVLQKLLVVSARGTYVGMYPDSPADWKAQAFRDVQREIDPQTVMNMVAIGDADHEIDAARALRSNMPQAVVKTVRFCPNPTPRHLLAELRFVNKRLTDLVHDARNRELTVPFHPRSGSSTAGGA